MIVLDANLLLYAYDDRSPRHFEASEWLEQVFRGPELIGLPWQVLWAFLRLSTSSRVFTNSLSMEAAIDVVEQWMSQRYARLLAPGERHWGLLRQMLIGGAMLAIVSVFVACGGSSSPKTPGGTSSVTVTATSGSITHTTTVTLIVQ